MISEVAGKRKALPTTIHGIPFVVSTIYRILDSQCTPLSLSYTYLMFYWEFFDVSKFLGIVLNAICSQVQSERFSDNVFASNCVAQTFVSHRNDERKGF